MDLDELDRALRATLDDGRLSRTERHALSEVLRECPPTQNQLAQLRARAFALVEAQLSEPKARPLLAWLEGVIKLMAQHETSELAEPAPNARAYFSPGETCLAAILGELGRVKQSADICVFTITDDRIAEALLAARQRGVTLRIITDNDKQYDEGSDIARLRDAGVSIRVDGDERHMHHKFAVLDSLTLLSGSYNWTRGATLNEENLIVTSDRRLVASFAQKFEALWTRFGL
ncbi:MAG TPA: phospholipase D-like domain-containing protein [Polyangiaceae bacterium]|nr:phospholipase D-like domain-containing protein [Polyangiaceae bacterium]